eukprot:TRINITY_DN91064_c0_g1_i1.p1 TRINITY_DN91064_c0_g1~~TRINITY_DN91064_c0_g1_i1.p1  ORF type:complete len:419 (-),score=99.62 TRINITY_DN91064_c0_g1_i1:243-1499(-)
MRTIVVHWGDLAARIPIGADFASKQKRLELFEGWNTDGKGLMHQHFILQKLRRVLPTINGIPDSTPMLRKAWKSTVAEIPPIVSIGSDWMDRNQLRCFYVYIHHYLKIFELLQQQPPPEMRGFVGLPEFEAVVEKLREWGWREPQHWFSDLGLAFEKLTNGANLMVVEDFIDRLVTGSLVQLSSQGAQEERKEAIRLLQRTHPHMFPEDGQPSSPSAPSGSASHRGGKTPFPYGMPPPGQKLPNPGFVQRNPPTKSWLTQYMCDFEHPSVSSAPSNAGSAAPSRNPEAASSRVSRVTSQNPTRLHTPGRQMNKMAPMPLSLSHASRAPQVGGLRAVASEPTLQRIPEAGETFGQLDRDALRSKLERHLEMSSTFHMRKLLKVAGGMTLGQPGPSAASRLGTQSASPKAGRMYMARFQE